MECRCCTCKETARFVCGGCAAAYYCSEKCGSTAWKTHRTHCIAAGYAAAGKIQDPGSRAAARLAVVERLLKENERFLDVRDTYPVDAPAAGRWIREQQDGDVRRFAAALIGSLRHVSYAEFLPSLERVCGWLDLYMKTVAGDASVFVMLPGRHSVLKSNTWATLLALRTGAVKFSGLMTDVSEAYDLCRRSEFRKTVVCAWPDDALYTGQQMKVMVRADPVAVGRLFMGAETDHDVAEAAGTTIITLADGAGLIVRVPLVPFVGTLGLECLGNVPGLIFPAAATVFRSARDVKVIAEAVRSESAMQKVSTRMRYHIFVSVMYFDHKLGDALSTMRQVLRFGEVFDAAGNVVANTNFIKGCRAPKTGHENDCPPAHYRAIPYTLDGRSVTGMRVSELFL